MSVRPYRDKKTGDIVPNKFILDFYPKGRKGKQVKVVVDDVTEAQAHTLELACRRQANNTPVGHDPKVIDVWPDFLIHYARDHTESTIIDIQYAAVKLMAHFGDWHLSRLTLPLCEQYLDSRSKDLWRPPITGKRDPNKIYAPAKPISKGRINTELKYFSAFLTYCVAKAHMLPLMFPLPKFKRLPKVHPILPSLDEIDRLLPLLHDAAYLALLLYHDAGLRRDEALNLQTKDVMLDDSAMSVIGKGRKQRFVIIKTDRLRQALEKRLAEVKSGGLLVNPDTGQPYKDLSKAIKNAAEKAGISLRIYNHLFRHAHATRSLEAGESLENVRQDLGHADIGTTQGYLHVMLESRRKDAEKFEEFLAAKKLMRDKGK